MMLSRRQPIIFRSSGDGFGEHRPAGYQTPWRVLPATLMEWSEDGVWRVDQELAESRDVPANSVLVVPPHARHRLTNPGPTGLRTNWVLLSFELDSGLDILAHAALPRVVEGDDGALVRDALRGIREHPEAEDMRDVARRHTRLFRLLELLMKLSSVPLSLSELRGDRLSPALGLLRTRLHEKIDRTRLASEIHLSPTRLHYVFKQQCGMAPMGYVTRERIRMAQHLLTATDLSAKQVASRCGFQTPQYFSRVFRRHTGQTPRAFRTAFAGGAHDAHSM